MHPDQCQEQAVAEVIRQLIDQCDNLATSCLSYREGWADCADFAGYQTSEREQRIEKDFEYRRGWYASAVVQELQEIVNEQ